MLYRLRRTPRRSRKGFTQYTPEIADHIDGRSRRVAGQVAFDYVNPFQRESGTANTTLGNTITLIAVWWALFRYYGIDNNKWGLLVGGDDTLAVVSNDVPKDICIKVCKEMDKLGLKTKPIIQPQGLGTFYSRIFAPCVHPIQGEGYALSTLIGRALAKNFTMLAHKGRKQDWMFTVFDMRLVYEWSWIPVLRVLAKIFRDLASRHKGKRKKFIEWKQLEKMDVTLRPNADTYQFYSEWYDIPVQQIYDLEKWLHKREHYFTMDGALNLDAHPVVSTMIRRDCC
jgi:hypothetical protein